RTEPCWMRSVRTLVPSSHLPHQTYVLPRIASGAPLADAKRSEAGGVAATCVAVAAATTTATGIFTRHLCITRIFAIIAASTKPRRDVPVGAVRRPPSRAGRDLRPLGGRRPRPARDRLPLRVQSPRRHRRGRHRALARFGRGAGRTPPVAL